MSIRPRLLALASASALLPAFLGTSTQPSWAIPTLTDAHPIPIGAVQGAGTTSPYAGRTVVVEGVVTGDFQGENQLGGVFIQDTGDGDEDTSDGIFITTRVRTTWRLGTGCRSRGK